MLAFFNSCVGGPANGMNYLADSNFDWGQNGKLLKQWVETNHVAKIYVDYFGTGTAIDYMHIPNERVKAPQARKLTQGYLVISATYLLSPDYDRLRATCPPTARIGNTLFVYALPTSSSQLRTK